MNTFARRKIFRQGSTTYYYSSLFFPYSVRTEVFILYAYVRTADNFVDSIPADTKSFEKIVADTWKAWDGVVVEDEIVMDFVALAKKRGFEKAWVEAFLWSMEQDLTVHDYATMADLEKYIYGSAEVIGLMMARIFGLSPEAEAAARMQGKAMQFLNFIRDVTEDKELGRVYMPKEDRVKFGIQDGDWEEAKWSKLIQFELDRYYAMQQEAEKGYRFIPRRYRVPVQTAAQMYVWTARTIERSPEVVWKFKVKPSKWRVMMEYIKNYLSFS